MNPRSLLLSLLVTLFCLGAAGQADLEKLQAEYEQMLKDPKSVPYGKNPAAGRFYNIRGFKMYAEIYGKGAPLLIIHGNSGSIANFVYQIPYFAKDYQVIVADSRAQGKSSDPGDSLTYEMMADDLSTLLDTLHVDSAYVIGWSDGGINGLLLAMRHPEKVKKLAVTGANLWPDTTAVVPEVIDMIMPDYVKTKAQTTRTPQQKNAFKLLNLLVNEPHITLQSLGSISCPSLIIGGDHDVIREEHTMQIYQHIPRAYLWILPASGHSTPIVYKDEFNSVIGHFFKTPYRVIQGGGRFS